MSQGKMYGRSDFTIISPENLRLAISILQFFFISSLKTGKPQKGTDECDDYYFNLKLSKICFKSTILSSE